MNPHGKVVTENTNGIVTVTAIAFKSQISPKYEFCTAGFNRFTEPFKNSNEYGESIQD